MTGFLLLILALICVLVVGRSLRQKGGVYRYPFLAGSVFTGFALVQLVGLTNNIFLPTRALDKTIFMTVLCLVMVYAGDKIGARPYRAFAWQYSRSRLLVSSAVLSLIGAFFFFQISRLPIELKGSQWTGIVVAYNFFAQALTYGLAIAALIYAGSSSKIALGIVVFDLLFFIDRIFIGARRGDTAELLVIIALALWFKRGLIVSKSLVIGLMVLGTFFIYSTGDYRESAVEKSFLDAINDISFTENLLKIWDQGGVEMENAVYQIEAADRNSDYDFGAFHWNTLIFNYVPAQILGEEFKSSLLINTSDRTFEEFGYAFATGSTLTGMADSFRSFWYFGALQFFVIAYVLARIYRAAMVGNMFMQLLYVLMLVNGLHSITHHTNWFFSPWVHLTLFLMPALLYARVRRKEIRLSGDIDIHKNWIAR